MILSALFLVLFSISFGVSWYFVSQNQLESSAVVDEKINDQIEPKIPAPSSAPASNEPPKQSLVGKLAIIEGDVSHFVRGATEYQPATPAGLIKEAESLEVGTGSATLAWGDEQVATVSAGTTVVFSSTHPEHFLFNLQAGGIKLQTTELLSTLSVRTSRALFELKNGSMELERDPATRICQLKVLSGVVKVGFLGSDNNTQIVEVSAGVSATFDEAKRTLIVSD